MKRSRSRKLICLFCCLALFAGLRYGLDRPRAQSDDEMLAQQAVSILQSRCVQCHGAKKTSGLDLRNRDGLLKGGSRGAAIKPGNHEESLLYRFIEGEEKPQMPLGDQLNAVDSEVLKAWIDKGAPWPSEKILPVQSQTKP